MDNRIIEIKVENDDNLESIVYKLLTYKAQGKQAYCVFNGVRLNSNTVTMESAYREVIGKTKEELDKIKQEALSKKDAITKDLFNEKEEIAVRKGLLEGEINDIKRTCAKVVQGFMTGEEGDKYLKENYGLVWGIYSYNGLATLKFADGRILRFSDLMNVNTDEIEEDLEDELLEEDDIIIKK